MQPKVSKPQRGRYEHSGATHIAASPTGTLTNETLITRYAAACAELHNCAWLECRYKVECDRFWREYVRFENFGLKKKGLKNLAICGRDK